MCKTFWLRSDINEDTFLSRYLKKVWREDPAPGWIIHQVQNAVNPRQPVDGSKEVNPVPVVTRVLTHRLHLLQILHIHIASACVPPTDTGFVTCIRPADGTETPRGTSHTWISSLFQLRGCGAQADPQSGCVEQELCGIFLSVWNLFPGHPAQEADFCLSVLLLTLQLPGFRAQQRVLREVKSFFKINNIESHQN